MSRVLTWKIIEIDPYPPRLYGISFSPEPGTLNQATRQLPEGVYTTFRTFEGQKVLAFTDHIRRLEESAALIGYQIRLDLPALKASLGECLHEFSGQDVRIRITIDLTEVVGTIYISLEPLVIPSTEAYESGVLTVSFRLHRDIPHAKRTSFVSIAESLRAGLPQGINEGLLLDDQGHILEGLSSNFFAVKNGVLWTSENSVLPGITRALVLQIAGQTGIPVIFRGVALDEILGIQEAFLSSSSRAILPIRQIDQTVIGAGNPGPLTRRLMAAFQEFIQARLETL